MAKSKKSTPATHSNGRPNPAPITGQRGQIIQEYGEVTNIPIGLDNKARKTNVGNLNQVLADTITLRDMYKKHHWQVAGHTFYQLHLLYDKHADELTELVDLIGERIQILGGIALAMAADVAETTKIERPPRGREEVPVQIDRLIEAHNVVLDIARKTADGAEDNEDKATNDLMASKLIPTSETQVWFISEHVVDVPLVQAE